MGFDVQNWVETFSYPAVILLLTAAGLGAPISEDLVLITGGAVVARTNGSLWGMAAAAYCGVLLGDGLLFRIGRGLGPRIVANRWTRKIVTPERAAKLTSYFDRHGGWTVIGARFVPGFRAATFLTAGACGLRPRTFFLADGAAALVTVPFWTLLGWHFGQAIFDRVKAAGHWVALGVAALIVVVLTARRLRRKVLHPAPPAGR